MVHHLTLYHLPEEAEIFLISSLCLLNLLSFFRQEDIFFSNLLLSRSSTCTLKQIIHHYLIYLLCLLFLGSLYYIQISIPSSKTVIRKALIVSTLQCICPGQKNKTSLLRTIEQFGWSVITRVLISIFLKDPYNVSFLPQSSLPSLGLDCHFPNIMESTYVDPLCWTLLKTLQKSLQCVNSKGN